MMQKSKNNSETTAAAVGSKQRVSFFCFRFYVAGRENPIEIKT